MTRLALVVLLLVLVVPAFAQSRGVLSPAPEPINPATFAVELSTIQPMYSSGADWTKATITAGLAWKIAQPKNEAGALLCPDKAVVFLAQDEPGLAVKYLPGATVDWLIYANFSVCAGGVLNVGWGVGAKLDLYRTEF